MSQLVQINDYFIDPARVISVTPAAYRGSGRSTFFINVDMRSWTASYEIEDEPHHGWTADSAAAVINEART